MATMRVPNKLLNQLHKERGMAFLVSITAHMIGEMKKPASILIDTTKISGDVYQILVKAGCREI